jgi:hypothetical protein
MFQTKLPHSPECYLVPLTNKSRIIVLFQVVNSTVRYDPHDITSLFRTWHLDIICHCRLSKKVKFRTYSACHVVKTAVAVTEAIRITWRNTSFQPVPSQNLHHFWTIQHNNCRDMVLDPYMTNLRFTFTFDTKTVEHCPSFIPSLSKLIFMHWI